MTQVAFHFNVPDKLGYACRLLRKATAGGAQVAVTGQGDLLDALDTELWTFSAAGFVAHARLGRSPAGVVERSPVVLAEAPQQTAVRDVLLNLGDEVPEGFDAFGRVIEIVTGDEADRQRARARWKHYLGQGFDIVRHDIAQAR